MTASFEYDHRLHAYVMDGEPIPSITDIVCPKDDFASTRYTDEHRDRGHLVHALTRAIDEGTFRPEMVPAGYEGFASGWSEFLALFAPKMQSIETPFGNRAYRIGGTPDRVAILPTESLTVPAIIDIKSGAVAEWHALQTAGYAVLIDRPDAIRVGVYLSNRRQRPVVKFHRNPGDISEFKRRLEGRRQQ